MTSRPGLHRDPHFLRLWAATAISQAGSWITLLALPLTAVLRLHAGAAQMGALTAVQEVPAALLGLPAGAWIDRRPRRPVMIASDLARAALLGSIPLAALIGVLGLPQLFLVAFGAAVVGLVGDLAAQALLPAMVTSEQLPEANARLELSESVAQLSGPALGGALVAALGAPLAIAADALSFVCSALFLTTVSVTEPEPAPRATHLRGEIAIGLSAVWHDVRLRTLAGTVGLFTFFDSVLLAVYMLYLTRTLHIGPALIGLIFGVAGVGGIIGALLAPRLAARHAGLALVGGVLVAAGGELAIAAARGPLPAAVVIVTGAEVAVELGASLYSVTAVSLRTALTPAERLGRVAATVRLAAWCAAPPGALIGGFLGTQVGTRETVFVAGVGTLLAPLWIAVSPLRQMRVLPATI